ncbi:hypothetical protein Tdes44962_MAKER06313 [Teratosphaeria destructans]|uniref:Uncharacterized protein n=1 Tax=Teratosphaeria destructans TaxID=418781 RepID=A0A9W7VXI9_9PEZI|nr:hypothetical protein Tdes44962_MAKER06313 [Teratosphaeria destructans]
MDLDKYTIPTKSEPEMFRSGPALRDAFLLHRMQPGLQQAQFAHARWLQWLSDYPVECSPDVAMDLDTNGIRPDPIVNRHANDLAQLEHQAQDLQSWMQYWHELNAVSAEMQIKVLFRQRIIAGLVEENRKLRAIWSLHSDTPSLSEPELRAARKAARAYALNFACEQAFYDARLMESNICTCGLYQPMDTTRPVIWKRNDTTREGSDIAAGSMEMRRWVGCKRHLASLGLSEAAIEMGGFS